MLFRSPSDLQIPVPIALNFMMPELQQLSIDADFSDLIEESMGLSYRDIKNFIKNKILLNANIKSITYPFYKFVFPKNGILPFENGSVADMYTLLTMFDTNLYFVLKTSKYYFLFNNNNDNKDVIVETTEQIGDDGRFLKKINEDSILSDDEFNSLSDNIIEGEDDISVNSNSILFYIQNSPPPAYEKNSFGGSELFTNNIVTKLRIQSENSKKKFDVNISYNLQVADGINLKSSTKITKAFEILKSEPL